MASNGFKKLMLGMEELGEMLNQGDEYFDTLYSSISKDELDEYRNGYISEDIDEAILTETDESGNDEMDANCEDCGAVITISVDHEGPAYCANCMKNHLHEALEDYKLTYYLSTATAERRPETIEDVENDWKEEVFAAESDYDALLYALELIDSEYDDTDFSTVEEIIEYFEEKDLGDGSAFVVKLEGPNGVIYDMGQTKDDFIEQVKENDKMLSYYRDVLGIDESKELNEAAKRHLEKFIDVVDNQDLGFESCPYIVGGYKGIHGNEFGDDRFNLSDEGLWATGWTASVQNEEDGPFTSFADIELACFDDEKGNQYDLPTIPESIQDKFVKEVNNYISESKELDEAIDPSKALEVKKNSNADVIFYGYQYKNEKPVEFDPPKELSSDEYDEEIWRIVNSKTKLNPDKPTSNRYGYDRDFIFYALYNRKNEELNEGNLDILNAEKDDNKMNEDMSIRAKLKALYPELNFGDEVTEGFDDDMDFDIDESHENCLMDSLYEGSDDFDMYDDEALEESSDCEDDECWENDLISEEFDDDAEWWNDTLDDETGDFIYQAAKELGLEDFWFEDNGYEGAHTPTEFGYTKDGITYKATCDYEDTDVHSVTSAVNLLKNLDWRAE